MPLSKQHKQSSKEKILNSARQLFSTKGFNNVSIDNVMNHAGLTRGAFYAHFSSKQALYSESISYGMRHGWLAQHKPEALSQKEWIKQLVSSYLSEYHVKQENLPCPLAFLVTDIANTENEVKTTYTHVFKSVNTLIQKGVNQINAKEKTLTKSDSYSALAMMIGAVAVARALDDEKITSELLNSSRDKLIELFDIN